MEAKHISQIPISRIVVDPRFDVRLGFLNDEAIEEYAGRPEETMPPGIVTPRGSDYVLIAGRHRLEALKLKGSEYMRAAVVEGTDEELYALAVRDNADAKVNYTREQKHEAIRRMLEMGWGPSKISLELGFGKNTVDKVKRAEASKARIGEKPGLTHGHYIEIYAAPEELQERLADTVARKGWTTAETRTVAQALKNEIYPETMIDDVLSGSVEPFTVDMDTGEPALHTDTVRRIVGDAVKSDAAASLMELSTKFERWQDLYSQTDYRFDEMPEDKARRLDGQLQRMASIIGDVRMELHRVLYSHEEA